MPPEATKQTAGTERIETTVLALTVVVSLALVPLMGSHVAAGAGIGGLVAFANLWMLRTLVTGMLAGRESEPLTPRRKVILGFVAFGKFVVLYGGLFVLMTRTPISRIGFLIGFSTLLLGIVADGLRKQQPGSLGPEGEHAENS
ncbi:MAG: ATP synthase subunit I [Chrysiogenetes bacterium]|nr:ATP synthase subunit I [Chrysiogenetes bacterium]